MKPNIHPKYYKLTIIVGPDSLETYSALAVGVFRAEKDFRTIYPWNKENANSVDESDQNIAKFNEKFAGLFSGPKSKKD